MLSVDEALRLVEEHARALEPQRVPLGEAAELVLAEDVTSNVDSPPYDKAMMDGYAVVSSDRQPVRRVTEEIAAGAVPHLAVVPGTASRIMTGAPLPDGADAVVPVELSDLQPDGSVELRQIDPPAGQNVLPLGASFRAGDVLVRDGTLLRPIEIAMLAEMGHGIVNVRPRPRVAVLPTGNELVSVGERPDAGQIRNSNGPLLIAAASRAGATPLDLGIGRDDRADLRERISTGLEADVLLASGGVSAGKFDLVPEVLGELGVEQVFHKVSLRPGKPRWFGVKQQRERRTLVFGLPGNPVSSFVCFELFVRPTIAALAGRGFQSSCRVAAQMADDFQHKGSRASCLPARVTFDAPAIADSETAELVAGQPMPTVEVLPWRGSADLAALANANGLVHFSEGTDAVESGTVVDVLMV